MTRTYDSPVRRERAAATRRAILEAFAEQFGRPGTTDVAIPEAAERAGVSVRTVYHHFPDRQARVDGLAAWAEEVFGPIPEEIHGPDDLPGYARNAYARAGRHLELTRAMYAAGFANDVRLARLRERRRRIADVLAAIGAADGPTRRAAAVVSLLCSSEAGVPLLDIHGLTVEEAGEAAAAAVRAIVADLRRGAGHSGDVASYVR